MSRFVPLGLMFGLLPLAAGAQDAEWVEVRFHRVYLNNGYFIDGTLVKKTPYAVTLRLKPGEMTIKLDMVEKIEFMKIRSINEKPKEEKIQRPPPPSRNESSPKKNPADLTPERPEAPKARATKLRRPEEIYQPNPAIKKKVDEILAQVEQANVEEKEQVARRLLQVGGDTAAYLASLLEQSDREAGTVLIQTLHQMKDPQSVPVLTKLMASVNPSIRGQAASILADTQPSSAVELLQPLLQDEDPAVRGSVLTTLQGIGDSGSLSTIARLCTDSDREVRTRAIAAVFEVARRNPNGDSAATIFEKVLLESSGGPRQDLLLAVGRSGDPRLWTTVSSYLSDGEAGTRAAAATALGNLASSDANTALMARLSQETDSAPRVALAGAAQKLGLKDAIPFLINWLGDSEINVPAASLRALQTLTGTNLGLDRAPWDAWWEKNKPKG